MDRRRRSRWLALVSAAALGACITSCTPRPRAGDPFAGGGSGTRTAGRSYRVRLEVNCDLCLVQYWVGPTTRDASADQLWSRTLSLAPLQPTSVRLQATPAEGGRSIRYVRILVDGEVVAEQGCSDCRDATAEAFSNDRSTVAAEVVIPLTRQ